MQKKYIVRLSKRERELLGEVVKKLTDQVSDPRLQQSL